MRARLLPSRFHLRAPRYGGQVALRRPRKGSPSSRSIRVALAAGCLAWIAPGCSRPPRLAADLVITRANVWTGDPLPPVAEAIAVVGGRMALANSAALGRAGITEETPDPEEGAIVRDANGFPTGVLKDAAMELVTRVVPKMTPEQRLRAAKRALEHAASLGVTSVQDMN